jgi:4,5-dihydroxyphthalate decarboxylase
MPNLHLTLATGDYDHLRDFTSGEVRADGIDITHLKLHVLEIFHRMTNYREFDVSEMSMGRYVSLTSQNDQRFVAIPVFPSRVFRLSAFYVRSDGSVQKPQDLKGKRIGVPEWAQTATIYGRGWLSDYVGVDLKSVKWVQAGQDDAGRDEPVALDLPKGIEIERVKDRSLNDMLLTGDIDAMIVAYPPLAFRQGNPKVKRLLDDPRAAEVKYWDDTSIFPIMHTVVMKREVAEANPWAALSLYKAFDKAKDNSLERAASFGGSIYPLPMHGYFANEAKKRLGDDFWPYGLEANRTTLTAFLKFARDQGVCHRLVAPEELFPASVANQFKM